MSPWIAVMYYLFVDVLYVLNSQVYYGNYVKKIQGKAMHVGPKKLWAAIASYMVLAVGWVILVAPMLEKQKHWYMAAFYGMIYGLSVYGVFNFTNHVMFMDYSISLVIRDTCWGVSWLTLFSVIYFYHQKKFI
jgi:uncharacterized membrane protein